MIFRTVDEHLSIPVNSPLRHPISDVYLGHLLPCFVVGFVGHMLSPLRLRQAALNEMRAIVLPRPPQRGCGVHRSESLPRCRLFAGICLYFHAGLRLPLHVYRANFRCLCLRDKVITDHQVPAYLRRVSSVVPSSLASSSRRIFFISATSSSRPSSRLPSSPSCLDRHS